MKKILLALILINCLTSLSYAEIVTHGGYAYTPITKTYSATGTASGTVVWDPADGQKIVLMGILIGSRNDFPPDTRLELETGFNIITDGTDVIPPMDITSGPIVISSGGPIFKGAADATLTITTNNSYTPVLTLWGYETSN